MSGRGIAGKLLAAIAICEGAGLIGSVFTLKSIPAWYDKLEKPAYTPPTGCVTTQEQMLK